MSVHGAPRYLRSDNGPEFVARAILRWLQAAQIETAFSDPGTPWHNGVDESFNGTFRDQHLSLQWFRNRADAKVSIEPWRRQLILKSSSGALGCQTHCSPMPVSTTNAPGAPRLEQSRHMAPGLFAYWLAVLYGKWQYR